MSKRQPRTKDTKTYKRGKITVVKAFKHGRPGDYSKAFDKLAFNFMLLGCTEQRIAEHLGVDYATMIRWKEQHPSFRKAFIDGGEKADAEVAKSMYRMSKGYKANEVTTRKEGKKTSVTIVEKNVAPNVRAAEIWLRNRTASRKNWTRGPEEDDIKPVEQPTININQIDLSTLGEDVIRKLLTTAKPGKGTKG